MAKWRRSDSKKIKVFLLLFLQKKKVFFFEKKKQKTFMSLGGAGSAVRVCLDRLGANDSVGDVG